MRVFPARLWAHFGRLERLGSRRSAQLAMALLFAVCTVALGADCVAADAPLIIRYHGNLQILPNIFKVEVLERQTPTELLASMQPGDWLIATPIPWGPNLQDKGHAALMRPSGRHWLGTDYARRDVAARLVHGSRTTMIVAGVSMGVCIALGTLLGLMGAYFGGVIDGLITRLTETFLSLPVFFFILAVVGLLESNSVWTLSIVIGAVYWTRVARLVRAEALRLRQMDFIVAARSIGCSPWRVIVRHLLPNVLPPILIAASFCLASATLIEASLSFLGFGVPDTTASWGGLMRGAMGHLHAWWLVLFPGLAISCTVVGYNILGDALRDALDPRWYGAKNLPSKH